MSGNNYYLFIAKYSNGAQKLGQDKGGVKEGEKIMTFERKKQGWENVTAGRINEQIYGEGKKIAVCFAL